jgi:hypothetical protein
MKVRDAAFSKPKPQGQLPFRGHEVGQHRKRHGGKGQQCETNQTVLISAVPLDSGAHRDRRGRVAAILRRHPRWSKKVTDTGKYYIGAG